MQAATQELDAFAAWSLQDINLLTIIIMPCCTWLLHESSFLNCETISLQTHTFVARGGQSARLTSQAVNSGISGRQPSSLGQHSSSAGQLSTATGQQRMRSSLNPAAPGFQSMRPPVANGLHPGPPKQQATGETGF